jgi:hypothetical protein
MPFNYEEWNNPPASICVFSNVIKLVPGLSETSWLQHPMGRWCATSYRGASTRIITALSAYQMYNTSPDIDLRRQRTTSRSMSAVTQQQAMINISAEI